VVRGWWWAAATTAALTVLAILTALTITSAAFDRLDILDALAAVATAATTTNIAFTLAFAVLAVLKAFLRERLYPSGLYASACFYILFIICRCVVRKQQPKQEDCNELLFHGLLFFSISSFVLMVLLYSIQERLCACFRYVKSSFLAVTATEEDDESDGNDDVDTREGGSNLARRRRLGLLNLLFFLGGYSTKNCNFGRKGPSWKMWPRSSIIISSQQSGGTEAESTQFASKRTFLFGWRWKPTF
jgi:hypothetical protein